MRKLQILILFTVFINSSLAQDSYNNREFVLKTTEYSITYSSNFRLDTNKRADVEFVLLTAKEGENDVFIENINLVKQNLSGLEIDIDSVIKINKTEIENTAQIIESKRDQLNDYDSYTQLFSYSQNGVKLIISQRFILMNNLLYVLSFSGEYDDYYKSEEEIVRIMKSFTPLGVVKNNKNE